MLSLYCHHLSASPRSIRILREYCLEKEYLNPILKEASKNCGHMDMRSAVLNKTKWIVFLTVGRLRFFYYSKE